MSATLGSVTIDSQINTGWGRFGWNEASWGTFGTANPTGIQASMTTGSVTITGQINSGWGRAEWGNEGWGVNETEVNVTATALPMTMALGDETTTAEVNSGWSRADQVWGDTDEAAAITEFNVCNTWKCISRRNS